MPFKNWNEDEWGVSEKPRKKFCTGFCVLKFFTLLYMIIYMILGAAILTISVLCIISKVNYSDVIDTTISIPAICCVIVGAIVLCATVVGLVGVVVEKNCPLKFFLVNAVLLFILQIVLVILLYIYRYKAVSLMGTEMSFSLHAYNEDVYVASTVDRIQRNWKCCGIRNSSDWNSNSKYSCGRNGETTCGTPDSCCINYEKNCGIRSRIPGMHGRLYHQGCEKIVSSWVDSNLEIFGAIALTQAIVNTLGIFITYLLLIRVKDRSRLFKLRKRIYF